VLVCLNFGLQTKFEAPTLVFIGPATAPPIRQSIAAVTSLKDFQPKRQKPAAGTPAPHGQYYPYGNFWIFQNGVRQENANRL
jgi:hypothetical protein